MGFNSTNQITTFALADLVIFYKFAELAFSAQWSFTITCVSAQLEKNTYSANL